MDHISHNDSELRKTELLQAIEKQKESIKTLTLYLECEKTKLVKMNVELDSLTSSHQNPVMYGSSFMNIPRIYEPFRF